MSDNRYERNRNTARGGFRPGSPYRRGPQQGYQDQHGRRIRPVWFVVVVDMLLLGLALNAFALGNSSLFMPATGGEDLPQPSVTMTQSPTQKPTEMPTATTPATETATGAQSSTESPTPQADPTPENQGMWGAQFADKFSGGEIISNDDTYKSSDISITIQKEQTKGIEFVVADIYIRNLDNFQAFFHNDKFGGTDSTLDQAKARNAILAINGDNAANRPNRKGYEIRNGKLFHSVPWQDVLVMYKDGSMKAFDRAGFETEFKDIKDNGGRNGGVWQVWTFGPMLLDANGQAMTQFAPDSITGSGNERSAIGYYEPGHYCFVTVGSVDKDVRAGMSLADLSKKMKDLGCTVAYNLDGGQSSEMVLNGKFINTPYRGGRSISDIICIGETN